MVALSSSQSFEITCAKKEKLLRNRFSSPKDVCLQSRLKRVGTSGLHIYGKCSSFLRPRGLSREIAPFQPLSACSGRPQVIKEWLKNCYINNPHDIFYNLCKHLCGGGCPLDKLSFSSHSLSLTLTREVQECCRFGRLFTLAPLFQHLWGEPGLGGFHEVRPHRGG